MSVHPRDIPNAFCSVTCAHAMECRFDDCPLFKSPPAQEELTNWPPIVHEAEAKPVTVRVVDE